MEINSTMKVAHIVPAGPFGGAQKVAADLASTQAEKGLDVALFWTGDSEGIVKNSAVDGVSVEFISGFLCKKILRLRRVMRDFAPEVVHLHLAPPWVVPFLPYRAAVIVVHLHNGPSASRNFRGWLDNLMQSTLLHRADVLLPVSRWVEDQWRSRFPNARFEVVLNGIPIPNGRLPLPNARHRSKQRIGFASRLAADKGIDEFAEFAMEFHKLCPDADFLIAGDGPFRAHLEEKTDELARSGCIRFLGFVDDMPRYWSEIDLTIFCAEKEPFGLRLIEPLAHGVPVVAYRTGAGSDEVIDLCSAIVAVPYGRPRELAEVAASILSDESRRMAIIEQGKGQVNANFSLARMASKVEQAYRAASMRRERWRR